MPYGYQKCLTIGITHLASGSTVGPQDGEVTMKECEPHNIVTNKVGVAACRSKPGLSVDTSFTPRSLRFWTLTRYPN